VSGLRRVDRETAHRRLLGMLARKGYGSGLAGIVVREALDAEWDDEATVGHPEQGLDAFLP
jgi:regulatory protein